MSNTALKFLRVALTCLGLPIVLGAHPMGNFSVSHYSRLYLKPDVTQLTYVLDLAEIPAFQLFESWGIDWKDEGLLRAKSQQQATEWLDNVVVMQGSPAATPASCIGVSHGHRRCGWITRASNLDFSRGHPQTRRDYL